MILFLDFDGVLHPEDLQKEERDRLFCCIPLLHEILRAAPGVDVVFSTSWRLLYSRDILVQMMAKDAPDLGSRFIGHTPHFNQSTTGDREDEIRRWLLVNNYDGSDWLALDDDRNRYQPDCKNLYWVDPKTGLIPEDVESVIELLRMRAVR